MNIASRGATMAVDWEQRIDFARLRSERLAKAQAALRASDVGALLLFDQNNIRYVSSTHIGEWARDKSARCVLLPREGDPVLWDFGSAAKHHQLYAPWLPESSWRAGVTSMRGAMPRSTGVPDTMAGKIYAELAERGLEKETLGIDLTDMETLFSLQRLGLEIVDSQPIMLSARAHKTADEIALLEHAAAIVDAVYEDIYRMLRPGVREHEIVAMAMQRLFELGSEQVEAINAVSGDRCNPHPHVFSDRLLRPGDQAFFDVIHSFMGYRTCYYRTFNVGGVTQSQLDAYKQCREWLDTAIDLVKPGMTTDRIAAVWPTAEELGFPDEQACFGLQFGHGLGVSLYEAPMISRVHSLDHPITIEPGMVFALETYCAASDGHSAARIEEEVVVTEDGNRDHHEVPRRGAARVRQDLRARRRPAARERGRRLMASATAAPAAPTAADGDLMLSLYRRMRLIRRFEEAVHSLFLKGEVHGTTHLYNGEEASATGVGSVLSTRRPRRGHLPRPRPRALHRNLAAGPPGRAARALDRRLRRPRRLDERDRPRARPDRLLRHRRRLDRRCDRRLAGAQGHGQRRRRVLRRGRDEPGLLPRVPQLRARVLAAGGLRVREQPLRRVHADGAGHRGRDPRPRRGPRRRLRARRRHGRVGDASRCAARDRARPGRSRPGVPRDDGVPLRRPLAQRSRASTASRASSSAGRSATRCCSAGSG